jgi:hypothetical protein
MNHRIIITMDDRGKLKEFDELYKAVNYLKSKKGGSFIVKDVLGKILYKGEITL